MSACMCTCMCSQHVHLCVPHMCSQRCMCTCVCLSVFPNSHVHLYVLQNSHVRSYLRSYVCLILLPKLSVHSYVPHMGSQTCLRACMCAYLFSQTCMCACMCSKTHMCACFCSQSCICASLPTPPLYPTPQTIYSLALNRPRNYFHSTPTFWQEISSSKVSRPLAYLF